MSAMLLGLLFGRVGGRQKQTLAHTTAHLQTAGIYGACEHALARQGEKNMAHDRITCSC